MALNEMLCLHFLKSFFTINVTQYVMKRKLSNTQSPKTTSKMNTIGGWIVT